MSNSLKSLVMNDDVIINMHLLAAVKERNTETIMNFHLFYFIAQCASCVCFITPIQFRMLVFYDPTNTTLNQDCFLVRVRIEKLMKKFTKGDKRTDDNHCKIFFVPLSLLYFISHETLSTTSMCLMKFLHFDFFYSVEFCLYFNLF